MKIGIITQPLQNNYGGLLQNYALQEVLRRMGHSVITIDQIGKKRTVFSVFMSCVKLFICKALGKHKNKNYPRIVKQDELEAISVNTQKFINKYIVHTTKKKTFNDFRTAIIEESLETLIVGSDQVWRPKYNINIAHSYFDFAAGLDVKKLSYAASFGVDKWEYSDKETLACKKLVKNFDAVSVREDSAIRLCKEHLETDAKLVLDPTMLLDKEDYLKLVNEAEDSVSKGDLFAYILDNSPKKQNAIKNIERELGLTAFYTMPSKSISETKNDIKACTFPSVTAWLRSFFDAKFVVCDSFHGAVFSIIFNKPFIVIGNERRGLTRFNSLLQTFALEERLVCGDSEMNVISKPIDWIKVNAKREELQKASIDFIKNNL